MLSEFGSDVSRRPDALAARLVHVASACCVCHEFNFACSGMCVVLGGCLRACRGDCGGKSRSRILDLWLSARSSSGNFMRSSVSFGVCSVRLGDWALGCASMVDGGYLDGRTAGHMIHGGIGRRT